MKTRNLFGLLFLALMVGVPRSHAEILVYRMRVSSWVKERNTVERSTFPSNLSYLWFLDLDTDYWVESIQDQTAVETILLHEQPRTARAPAAKSFTHYFEGEGDKRGDHRVAHKFEFFSRNSKFYYFYMQTEDRWHSGFDTGVILANGSCRQNVNIGGGRTSAVPSDFTGSMKRGDSGKFSSGVLSFKFDSSITIAANNYLKSQSVLSEKGSGKSQSISTAAQWLIQVYLPQNYPSKFPQELLE